MATSFPYASPGSLVKAFVQFKRSFPPLINANTLRKFAIAPNNESYVISVIRFLGLIDDDGNRQDSAVEYFYGDDAVFTAGLESNLRRSYKALFDDFGDAALGKSKDELLPWFRATDKSSETVGGRQANTFLALSGLAGHGAPPLVKPTASATPHARTTRDPVKKTRAASVDKTKVIDTNDDLAHGSDIGLTVRLEINLPPGGDEATYDAIFKSIRKNLIEGQRN